jgi:hypothetical protein
MDFEEVFDEFEPPTRVWRASSEGFTCTIIYNAHYNEYAANCHDYQEGILVGGPWDSFEEAKAACLRLLLSNTTTH